MIYLSDADIEGLGLRYSAMADAIEDAFARQRRAPATSFEKVVLPAGPSTSFYALPAVLDDVAGLKWLGYGCGNRALGLPGHAGIVVLNDRATGIPFALLSAAHLTAMRTAATTLVAARRLVRADRLAIGLAGYGVQALAHVRALGEIARIERITVLANGPDTRRIDEFFRALETTGASFATSASADDLVAGSDIVVSTLPPGIEPMLDARGMKPGAFAAMVDLGRAWRPESFSSLDAVFTDDAAALKKRAALEPQLAGLPIAGELGRPIEAASGARTAFLAPGTGLADMAAAMLVVEAARRKVIGVQLDL